MALTALEDDLLRELEQERNMVYEQIEVLDPLSVSLRHPLSRRFLGNTILLIFEYLCYLVAIAGILFTAMAHTIYPFTVLNKVYTTKSIITKIGETDFMHFSVAVYALLVLCVLLIFLVGRMARDIRIKTNLLQTVSIDVSEILAQHTERKAAIDYLEQKHEFDFSGDSIPDDDDAGPDINDIANPGYGD